MPSAFTEPKMSSRRRRRPYLPLGCIAPLVLSCLVVAGLLALPALAAQTYGPPSDSLGIIQRIQYSALMLWHDGQLTRPLDLTAGEQEFSVASGEAPGFGTKLMSRYGAARRISV